jgi:hypothetical protein
MAQHLNENDFLKNFPDDLDQFPELVNGEYFIDAWLLNSVYSSLASIENYLLSHKEAIEAPLGDDVIGDNGVLQIPIPPARYPSGKFAIANDENLVPGNIAKGVFIFGVQGSLESMGGGFSVSSPDFSLISETPILIEPPSLDMGSYSPITTTPTLTVS